MFDHTEARTPAQMKQPFEKVLRPNRFRLPMKQQ